MFSSLRTRSRGLLDPWTFAAAFVLASMLAAVLGSPVMATNVCAHITGTVWKIEVKEGDDVMEGQSCVILESMKMEMPVEAPASGKVEKVVCTEGQAVNEGDVLVILA